MKIELLKSIFFRIFLVLFMISCSYGYRILPSNSPGDFSNWKLAISFLPPWNSPPLFTFRQKLPLKWAKKHNLILLSPFCLYLSSIDAVQLSPNHCLIVMMVSSRVAMVRFLLKLLLVKSGPQDGALLFCVARVKKKGGEFLGGGELIGRIRYLPFDVFG